MRAAIFKSWIVTGMMLGGVSLYGQAFRIGTVDIYGNRTIATEAILPKMSLGEGDTIHAETFHRKDVETELEKIPGVKHARVNLICCDTLGNLMMYVGIGEDDSGIITYGPPPAGTVRLPDEMTATYDSLTSQILPAIQNGEGDEDDSNGYALIHYPPARSLQEKFVGYADDHFDLLSNVLKHSSDAGQRAAAAEIIAYGSNKRDIVRVLLIAVDDPDEDVRNNATRALGIIAGYAIAHPDQHISIPAKPFIRLVNSLVWTDRNKGALALMQITADRNPKTLKVIRQEALPSLIEMARWQDRSHAIFSFVILGRMAGEDEQVLYEENSSKDWPSQLQRIVNKIKP